MSITKSPSGRWRIGTSMAIFKSKAEAEKVFAMLKRKRLIGPDGNVLAGKGKKYKEEIHGYFHKAKIKAKPKGKKGNV